MGRLVVLGFNATLTAKVVSWRSVTHMCFLAFSHQYKHNFSFQSHRLLFSHTSAEVSENWGWGGGFHHYTLYTEEPPITQTLSNSLSVHNWPHSAIASSKLSTIFRIFGWVNLLKQHTVKPVFRDHFTLYQTTIFQACTNGKHLQITK